MVPDRPGVGGFSLWAPNADQVTLRTDHGIFDLRADADGWHTASDIPADVGEYRIEVGGVAYPDPASRAQAGDVHTSSRRACPVPAPKRWDGHRFEELVILELHVGTFTVSGTLKAAADRLDDLAALGITAVELMPLNQFSGAFGWGYDGVLPFAIHPAYGSRADLARFVDRAHQANLSVILDVVYNHFGPDGAYLHQICPPFFASDRHTPWGAGIDYSQRAVREFFLQNAEMWIGEFGIDGLRIDAAHQIIDDSDPHILVELARRARAAARDRPLHLILEDERNLPALREAGGYDAQWNDDYHHAVHCLLTGEDEGYYASFAVDPISDLCRALAEGHVEQGQARNGLAEPRGAPSAHLPPTAFVNANQTHDQIGNRAMGERLIALAGAERMRVAHALLLTSPAVPMLFMGEEDGARAPFQFFADYSGEMGEAVRNGRRTEFAAFGAFDAVGVPDPTDPATRDRSRPYAEPAPDRDDWRELTCAALTFRTKAVVPLVASGRSAAAEVRSLGPGALHVRWPFKAGTLETMACFFGTHDPPPDWEDAGLSFRTETTYFATRALT